MLCLSFLLAIHLAGNVHAQTRTVGLVDHRPGTHDQGYTLFSPITSLNTYLIDNCGSLVNSWQSQFTPGLTAYLTESGNMLRAGFRGAVTQFTPAGGAGGWLELYNWNGSLLWRYGLFSDSTTQHHDAIPLPNGNVLALTWVAHDSAAAVAIGRDPALIPPDGLWSERIVEIRPIFPHSAEIVWQWDSWDHLIQDHDSTQSGYGDPAQYPERLDVNFLGIGGLGKDWLHFNSLDYRADLDQVLISSRKTCEVYVIDHSTTTAEAAGHSGGNSGKGGDLLYRWGNPQSYRRGTSAQQVLWGQHHANWTPAGYPDEGKIMVFNNGSYRPGPSHSGFELFGPPLDSVGNYQLSPGQAWGPAVPDWTYAPLGTSQEFYSGVISGAQALPNGNALVSDGVHGTFFEVSRDDTVHWRYINPVSEFGVIAQGDTVPAAPNLIHDRNQVFRCHRYAPGFPGLAGKSLVAENPVEANPWPYACEGYVSAAKPVVRTMRVYPNPVRNVLHLELSETPPRDYALYDLAGEMLRKGRIVGRRARIRLEGTLPGLYILWVEGIGSEKVLVQP